MVEKVNVQISISTCREHDDVDNHGLVFESKPFWVVESWVKTMDLSIVEFRQKRDMIIIIIDHSNLKK